MIFLFIEGSNDHNLSLKKSSKGNMFFLFIHHLIRLTHRCFNRSLIKDVSVWQPCKTVQKLVVNLLAFLFQKRSFVSLERFYRTIPLLRLFFTTTKF